MLNRIAIVALISTMAAAPAWADDYPRMPAPAPAPAEKSQTPAADEDFGWQVVAADLAGLATSMVFAASGTGAAAVLPYLLAAPAVHVVHRDGGGAVGSLLLNAGVPTVGALLGYAINTQGRQCGGEDDFCGFYGLFIGTVVGIGVAAAVDAIALSHPNRPAAVAATPRRGIQVAPTLAIDPGGRFSLALVGRF